MNQANAEVNTNEALSQVQLLEGQPWPLGATPCAQGLNLAVFSTDATAVEWCLFDASGQVELARLALPGRSGDVWHGLLPAPPPGLVYGLRAHGPWAPEQGLRFNPHKLLLDPYAREVLGQFEWNDLHFGHERAREHAMDRRDNAQHALKARVPSDGFDWEGDERLHTPWRDTVLYELHVRSFSRQHPGVPESQRGTYAGLASDAALAHFAKLGITALSLLPVHLNVSEQRLAQQGMRNHWGYNTLGYFALEPHYAQHPHQVRDEFRGMVKRLHAAGIEVLLDVVFNHTAEAGRDGPLLSFRGLCNRSYYRLEPQAPGHYINWSGCGNSLNIQHPRVMQMVLDSLRYWVGEMHVDGFRFDLAPALGRGEAAFEPLGAFFKAVAQDPLLCTAKMVAEPWDLGPDGYRLGQFPPGWAEWNDKFRDTLRAYWLRHGSHRGELARRLSGSNDVFDAKHRAPSAGVNYIVSHDGFTLSDLLCYQHRHNLANGENNRDGHAHNLSWNCGHEGPSTDPEVNLLRERLARALLACTLLAKGTPMLASGDEIGHTQRGNNNPYCQDNTTSWLNWETADEALLEFVARVVRLRQHWQPLGTRWFTGTATLSGRLDVHWLLPNGQAPQIEEWHRDDQRCLGMQLNRPGKGPGAMLLLLNADGQDRAFQLPGGRWRCLLDTALPQAPPWPLPSGIAFDLKAHSVALLQERVGG